MQQLTLALLIPVGMYTRKNLEFWLISNFFNILIVPRMLKDEQFPLRKLKFSIVRKIITKIFILRYINTNVDNL